MSHSKRDALMWILTVLAWVAWGVIVWLAFAGKVRADCQPYPVTANSPTGIVGCAIYGEGIASEWGGPGVARNDCTYPWTACAAITITNRANGRSITVAPRMFCDCYTGTTNERIVDLDPASVAALGLDPSRGLWPVDVQPAGVLDAVGVPDTAYH